MIIFKFKKRVILVFAFFFISIVSKAQYNDFNPCVDVSVLASMNEIYMLDNIGFDVNAIQENPEALSVYKEYLSIEKGYLKGRPIMVWE